eukprot:6205059-Pleurochrysis_carterae.AAC.2
MSWAVLYAAVYEHAKRTLHAARKLQPREFGTKSGAEPSIETAEPRPWIPCIRAALERTRRWGLQACGQNVSNRPMRGAIVVLNARRAER